MHRLAPLALLWSLSFTATAAPVDIPAGAFQMGCSRGDSSCEKDEGRPGGTSIFVPAFRIDSHEVAVAGYRACVARGQCTPPLEHQRNQYCNFNAPQREAHPVNCVDWEQAQAFCRWKSGRLPWEAEWEKAARAGSVTRYPWGDRVGCAEAILDDGKTLGSAGKEPDGCGEDRTWPVGSRKPNAFGLYDMHGNAGEWTGNAYAPDAIARLYARGNLRGPESSPQIIVRGGSWDENAGNLRSSFRNTKPPRQGDSIYGSIGFRCAYSAR